MSQAASAKSFRAPAPPSGIPRRVALVTGSSKGIGIALGRQLGSAGFNVGLTRMADEDATDIRALMKQLREDYGVETEEFIVDLGDPDRECPKLMEAHISRFGRLDVLVNNAGWHGHAGKPFADLGKDTDEVMWKFRDGFKVNFEAPVLLSWLAVKEFRKQPLPDPETGTSKADNPDLNAGFYTEQWGIGRIINISSVHGQTPLPNSSVYTCAKHALNGLTRYMASELGGDGITVNAVAPGLIATSQNNMEADDAERPEHKKKGLFIPRPGRPSEIAATAGYLASVGGRYTTGQIIYVDGGFASTNPQFFW